MTADKIVPPGHVRREVRCACGAETREFIVHPATSCGLSCIKCHEPKAGTFTLTTDVTRYAASGELDRVTFRVSAYEENCGRYGFRVTETTVNPRYWTGSPRQPSGFGASGCAETLEGAHAWGVLWAAGTPYHDAERAKRIIDRAHSPALPTVRK